MKWLGMLLIVAGLAGLVYGGFRYTRHHTVLDVGPVQAKVDEKKSVPIPPVAGGAALFAGIVLVLADRRRA
jgi:hypothetical protein